MIPSNPGPAPTSSPLPQDLATLLPHRLTPWNVSSSLFNRVQAYTSDKSFKLCEVLNTDPEFNFILRYFEHQKPPGYSIKRIVCIHNPDHTQVFEGTLKNIERECNNPVFASKGKEEEPQAERSRVLTRWESQATQFSPVEIKSSTSRVANSYSKVKVLPLWHGSSKAVCQSVCWSGFTSFGKHHYFDEAATKGSATSTDKGYFGSGIYFSNSARYATMYSPEGHLLLTWVSMREPYPVVNDKPHPQKGSDMIKLGGKEHYQNYNAHYIPVASIRPQDPKCLEYYPCYKDQPPAWDEFVVFHTSQALPRFWVELGVDLPKVTLSDMANTGEFLTLLLSLLDKEEIKNHSALSGILQAHVNDLLEVSEETPLNIEEQKFFKSAKRLLFEEGGISSFVVNLLLQSKPPMRKISISEPSPQPVATGKGSNSEKPRRPTPFLSVHKLQPISLSLGEDDYQKGCSLNKSGDLKQAFLSYEKAAKQGDTDAQCRLGDCYYNGQGVAQDYKEAIRWYQKAAEQGHAVAQNNLGFCYQEGKGVARDNKKAVKWYQKAAKQGNAIAQSNLGFYYYKGQGVTQDNKEAIKWFQKAAEQGNAQAQCSLGSCYSNGQGVAQDYKEAVKWYQKAADQGNVGAQCDLGSCYKNGQGVTQDYKEAVKWFQKAANQGDATAQYSLGFCYEKGEGVGKDYKEAVKWYQKAAAQGNDKAITALKKITV